MWVLSDRWPVLEVQMDRFAWDFLQNEMISTLIMREDGPSQSLRFCIVIRSQMPGLSILRVVWKERVTEYRNSKSQNSWVCTWFERCYQRQLSSGLYITLHFGRRRSCGTSSGMNSLQQSSMTFKPVFGSREKS